MYITSGSSSEWTLKLSSSEELSPLEGDESGSVCSEEDEKPVSEKRLEACSGLEGREELGDKAIVTPSARRDGREVRCCKIQALIS